MLTSKIPVGAKRYIPWSNRVGSDSCGSRWARTARKRNQEIAPFHNPAASKCSASLKRWKSPKPPSLAAACPPTVRSPARVHNRSPQGPNGTGPANTQRGHQERQTRHAGPAYFCRTKHRLNSCPIECPDRLPNHRRHTTSISQMVTTGAASAAIRTSKGDTCTLSNRRNSNSRNAMPPKSISSSA